MTGVDLFLNVRCPVSEDLVQQLLQKLCVLFQFFPGHVNYRCAVGYVY